mmetsp:Transcript_135/g.340  ORF Transcript_135/g.340 Transcript_135/m.340 type:complete len:155 (-) Transcript_135:65-529(-)
MAVGELWAGEGSPTAWSPELDEDSPIVQASTTNLAPRDGRQNPSLQLFEEFARNFQWNFMALGERQPADPLPEGLPLDSDLVSSDHEDFFALGFASSLAERHAPREMETEMAEATLAFSLPLHTQTSMHQQVKRWGWSQIHRLNGQPIKLSTTI